jgi:hypothetical protein
MINSVLARKHQISHIYRELICRQKYNKKRHIRINLIDNYFGSRVNFLVVFTELNSLQLMQSFHGPSIVDSTSSCTDLL